MNTTILVIQVAVLAASVSIAATQILVSRGLARNSLIHQALELLNSSDLRPARRRVYGLTGQPPDTWPTEDIEAAELVGGQLSHLGFMLKRRYLRRTDFFNEAWRYRFIRTYAALAPYLEEERRRLDLQEHWIYFEWAARYAYKRSLNGRPWWLRRRWSRLRRSMSSLEEVERKRRENLPP